MIKTKNLFNLISLTIGTVTSLYIFGYDFLISKTTFFYHFDHTVPLTGYLAFINDSWHFPLAVTDNIYPGSNFSIVWTDSIPIFSIFLKLIYSIFGFKLSNPLSLWYFICYILLAFFVGKIIQLRTNNVIVYSISIVLLINTPLMINRMINHAALSAHWLIVASVYFYILNKENEYTHLNKHALNTGISLYVHPYIFTIIFPVFFVSIIYGFLKEGFIKVRTSLIIFLSLVAIYFSVILTNLNMPENSYKRPDFIKYGAQFNSFFCGETPNPLLNKYLLCDPPYTQISLEGYGYFGIGIIFLSIFLALQPKKHLNDIKQNWVIVTTLLFMVIYSFGNKWKIAHAQIFEFEPIPIHMKLLEIFRSTGRYTWAFYYFFSIYLVLNILKYKKESIGIFILSLALFLQLSEASNVYPDKSGWFQLYDLPNEQISLAKEIYEKNSERVLHVLPDERCSFPEPDHYIMALEYLKYGGTVFSTRTARLKIDAGFCEDYTINKSLEKYRPYHFVINNIDDLDATDYKKDYECSVVSSYLQQTSKPGYCKTILED